MPEMIARERIRPNDWNVNAFDAANYPKLVESIREKGIMEPLKVMPDPEREDDFLLVDGYHRWKAAGDLGIEELPCEVWEIDAEEAGLLASLRKPEGGGLGEEADGSPKKETDAGCGPALQIQY